MTKTERFSSLEDVHALRLLLKAERDARADDLRAHWERLQDKEFRRGLMLNAASDLFRSNSGNGGALGALASGVRMAGGWLPLVGPLLGGRKGVLGSRLFWTGLSLALPLLVNKDGVSRAGDVWDSVRNGIQWMKNLMRDHKATKVEEP